MKTLVLALFILTISLSQSAVAADNTNVFVVSFSKRVATTAQVTQELLDGGMEVLNSVDKHADGRTRRIQWVEVRVKSQAEIDYLYKVFTQRPGFFPVVTLEEWTQTIPDPILFNKPKISNGTIDEIKLSIACQKLFS